MNAQDACCTAFMIRETPKAIACVLILILDTRLDASKLAQSTCWMRNWTLNSKLTGKGSFFVTVKYFLRELILSDQRLKKLPGRQSRRAPLSTSSPCRKTSEKRATLQSLELSLPLFLGCNDRATARSCASLRTRSDEPRCRMFSMFLFSQP